MIFSRSSQTACSRSARMLLAEPIAVARPQFSPCISRGLIESFEAMCAFLFVTKGKRREVYR